MADIFTKNDAQWLLKGKSLWLFGDSNMRGIYKDLIWLLEKNSLICLSSLRGKLEGSYMNDTLIKGGVLHRGRNYQEIRQYKNFKLQITLKFTFLTRCMSTDIQESLKKLRDGQVQEVPDVILINSCLWDITRWGPESVEKYKTSLIDLLKLLKASFLPKTRIIWITTPPVSQEPRGGFFIKQIDFLKHTLRFDVMEANAFVSQAVVSHGFDVLDIHYHLLLQIHRRRPDGIHWGPDAVRHMTNLILTHICVAWEIPLPGNFKSPALIKLQSDKQALISKYKKEEEKICMGNARILPEKKNFQEREEGGKKRDFNGNFKEQSVREDNKEDDFHYDCSSKKFKAELASRFPLQ